MMDTDLRRPRWPLWVWGLQLLPASILQYFAFWRYGMGEQVKADPRITLIALAIGIAWMAGVLGLLVLPKGRSWLISRRKELCLSAVVLIICAVTLDVAITALGFVPTIEQQRARSAAYTFGNYTKNRLVPKEILVENGNSININNRGLRGQEIEARSKPGWLRIVVLGGSQVFDYQGGGWPGRVGDELQDLGYDVEVINGGVPGHNTFDSLGKLVTDLWTLKPDIIFLCQAWNDVKYFPWLSPEQPYRGLPPREAASWLKDWRLYPSGIDRVLSYSAIYRNFRWGIGQFLYYEEGSGREVARRKDAALKTDNELALKQYRLNVNLIASLAREVGAELVLCKQAHLAVKDGSGSDQEIARAYGLKNTRLGHVELMRALDATNRIIEEIALDRELLIVDMNGPLSGRKENFFDGIHFSPEGSRAVSKLVASSLLPVVTRLSETAPSN